MPEAIDTLRLQEYEIAHSTPAISTKNKSPLQSGLLFLHIKGVEKVGAARHFNSPADC